MAWEAPMTIGWRLQQQSVPPTHFQSSYLEHSRCHLLLGLNTGWQV